MNFKSKFIIEICIYNRDLSHDLYFFKENNIYIYIDYNMYVHIIYHTCVRNAT